MNIISRSALPILVAGLLASLPVSAHEWYPKECCSGRDCVLADRLMIDDRGDRIVLVGSRRIWVSKYVSPRPSPDGRVHICVREVNGELDGALDDMPLRARRELIQHGTGWMLMAGMARTHHSRRRSDSVSYMRYFCRADGLWSTRAIDSLGTSVAR
jgi:hypothetical protein